MPETVLRPDQSESFQLSGTGVIFKLKGDQTNGRVSLVEHTVAPCTLAAPLHPHRDEDEISYILEGELTFLVGNRIMQAVAGTIVVKPREIPHTFWNAGAIPARLLEMITLAGFEEYFQELALLVGSGCKHQELRGKLVQSFNDCKRPQSPPSPKKQPARNTEIGIEGLQCFLLICSRACPAHLR